MLPSASKIPGAPALLAVASLVVASIAAAQESPSLTTAAAASGRPRECNPGSRGAERDWHVNLWDGVRQPQLRRYCDLLGRAHARLKSSPGVAREAADLADQVLPGHAAPWVLRGRANAMLGDWAQAVRDFERARTIDPRSVEEPQSLVDMAVALRKSGKPTEALTAYRVLITRLALLPSPETRVRVILEAASLVMSSGEAGLPEAIAVLREGVRQPLTRYDADVHALLLLALDRAGAFEQSPAVVEHLARSGAVAALRQRDPATFDYLPDPAESSALLAIALERPDPASAIASWERFLANAPTSVFAPHARRHVDSLRKTPRALPARKPPPPAP